MELDEEQNHNMAPVRGVRGKMGYWGFLALSLEKDRFLYHTGKGLQRSYCWQFQICSKQGVTSFKSIILAITLKKHIFLMHKKVPTQVPPQGSRLPEQSPSHSVNGPSHGVQLLCDPLGLSKPSPWDHLLLLCSKLFSNCSHHSLNQKSIYTEEVCGENSLWNFDLLISSSKKELDDGNSSKISIWLIISWKPSLCSLNTLVEPQNNPLCLLWQNFIQHLEESLVYHNCMQRGGKKTINTIRYMILSLWLNTKMYHLEFIKCCLSYITALTL